VTPSQLAEFAVAIALAAVLSLFRIKLPHLAFGGSISLHMLPIIVIALRHGVRSAVPTGMAYGVINFIMTPYPVHPIQIILDYPVAFSVLGLAGLAARHPAPWAAVAAVVGAGTVRLGIHVLSGILYFAELAPEGTPVWKYSLIYNSSYMVPEILIASIAMGALSRRLPKGDLR
jgi:thiamine transporter